MSFDYRTVFATYDFTCSDCQAEFKDYEFLVFLHEGSNRDGDISCPSCGGGDKNVSLPARPVD